MDEAVSRWEAPAGERGTGEYSLAGEADAGEAAGADGSRETAADEYADVPFRDDPRWNDVVGKKKAAEAELASLRGFAPVIERLKGMGFASADAVTNALAAEEQRLFQQNLSQSLNEAVRSGRINPATAQERYQAALQERVFGRTIANLAQQDLDRQVQAAKVQYPEMDEDLVREYAKGNYGRSGFDLADVARRSHERNVSYFERKLAGHEAERAKQPAAPVSGGRGSVALNGSARSALKRSWEDLLGLTKLAQL